MVTGIEEAGYTSFPRVVRAGMVLDLLIVEGERALAVDLIGYAGPLSTSYPMERIAILGRAGIPVFPLDLAAWRRDREAVIEALGERLGS